MEKQKARLDKWLWSVRIFKTRTIATKACQGNRIKINHRATKPASTLIVGDVVQVQKNGINYSFLVKTLLEQRVGHPIAITCYENLTPQEELQKHQQQFLNRHKGEYRPKGEGRPSKKDRRDLEDFKTLDIDFEDYFDDF